MLNQTNERSPWWDVAIAVAPALIAVAGPVVMWWLGERKATEDEEQEATDE